MFNKLKYKFKSKNISVCIIGLGYVGLPLASRVLNAGITVYGLDTDLKKIKLLRSGKSYIRVFENSIINYFKKNPKNISNKYSIIKNCDVVILCLPTPLTKVSKKPDMSYVFNCAKEIKNYIKKNQLIIIESTVYPGATNEFQKKLLSKKFSIGEDIFIGYSPERENPGDKKFSYKRTPKIISGSTKKCLDLTNSFYQHFVKKLVKLKSIKEAETSKLLENLYRSVNISLINELKIVCHRLGMDIFNIIDAAATKNFGFQKFLPGPGLGGHCIPIDPYYLAWASKNLGYNPKFIKLSGDINAIIPKWTINKILENFKNKNNIRLLLLGVSYKKNVDDDRESTFFEFMKILNKKKIKFDYSDPYFPILRKGRNSNILKKSIKLDKNNLMKYDASIILADHDLYDYELISKHSKIVFDTRGKFKDTKLKKFKNIIFC